MKRFLLEHPNLSAVFILTLTILFIGWFEMSTRGAFSSLTGGIVTFNTIVRIGILTIVVVGLNMLMGYAGQASLGQAAFYGMGAYFSAILTARADVLDIPAAIARAWWWPWLLIVLGMLLTGAFAYLIGRPILRLKGHYLAMATLGLGIMIAILFRENFGISPSTLSLTGGSDGIAGIPRLRIGAWEIWPITRYYFLVWGVAIAGIVLALNIVNSRAGRALRAIHSSDLAAETVGIDTAEFKTKVFALSAMYASLAGSLYAHFQVAVSPATFDFIASLELVVMAAVGGMASVWGAPFGVAMIFIIHELLRTRLHLIYEGASGEHEVVMFGLILVLIMVFAPEGLIGSLKQWLGSELASLPATTEGPGGD
ncbi:MAG: branched-chain amino acid ABC transporter permease [Chloroflexota bacterium]|nr:branched-chain amino acid ABC transporter permease [Chloroflexota bacterium]